MPQSLNPLTQRGCQGINYAFFQGENEGVYNWSLEHGNPEVTESIEFDLPASAIQQWPRLIAGILGYPFLAGDGVVQRVKPLPHPLFQSGSCEMNMYATKISNVRGLGAPEGDTSWLDKNSLLANFVRWKADVRFEVLPFYLDSTNPYDAYFIRECPPTLDIVTAKTNNPFKYTSAAPAIDQGQTPSILPALRLPRATFSWIWVQLPSAAIFDSSGFPSLLAPAMGCINSDTFADCSPGTLLFQPPRIRRYMAAVDGQRMGVGGGAKGTTPPLLYDLTYLLAYFARGWNNVPDSAGGWSLITQGGAPDGPTLYQSTVFANVVGVSNL